MLNTDQEWQERYERIKKRQGDLVLGYTTIEARQAAADFRFLICEIERLSRANDDLIGSLLTVETPPVLEKPTPEPISNPFGRYVTDT